MEVANGLQMAVRRKRIDAADREEALSVLRRLSIEIRAIRREHDWGIVLGLANRHSITAYDASCLALALEASLPLATFDGELIAAARAEGVVVLP